MREPSATAQRLFAALRADVIESVGARDPSVAVAVAVRFRRPQRPIAADGNRRVRYTYQDATSRVVFPYDVRDDDTGHALHTFLAVLAVDGEECGWHQMQFLGKGEQDDHQHTRGGRPDGR